jgi:hypothetical protein
MAPIGLPPVKGIRKFSTALAFPVPAGQSPLPAASRSAALSLLLVTAAPGSPLPREQANARKRRKKRRKPSPRPSCADLCPPTSQYCFGRPVGPPLCGEIAEITGCTECATDQDCIESTKPYCITTITERATNETTLIGLCPNQVVGFCAAIDD